MGKIANVRRAETSTAMAKRFGVHPVTIRRLVSLPRDQYESESHERNKPWEALGISRTTWYRQGKPMPPAEDGGQQQEEDDDEAGESPAT